MTEAEKAAKEFVRDLTIKDYGTLNREGSMTFEKAFRAGALWQREQDAKLCEQVSRQHDTIFGDYPDKTEWLSEKCAVAIRAQHAKQECDCRIPNPVLPGASRCIHGKQVIGSGIGAGSNQECKPPARREGCEYLAPLGEGCGNCGGIHDKKLSEETPEP